MVTDQIWVTLSEIEQCNEVQSSMAMSLEVASHTETDSGLGPEAHFSRESLQHDSETV